MKYQSRSRRMFLEGALGATLAIPFLESLLPKVARGAAAAPIKRLIVMKTYSTQIIFDWYPSLKGNGYILKDDKYTGNKADGTTLLTKPVEAGSKYMSAPLADFATGGHLAHLGNGAQPVLVQDDAPARARFPSGDQPQLCGAPWQLLVV